MKKAGAILSIVLLIILTVFSSSTLPTSDGDTQSSLLVGFTEEERHGSHEDDVKSPVIDLLVADHFNLIHSLPVHRPDFIFHFNSDLPSPDGGQVLLPPEL